MSIETGKQKTPDSDAGLLSVVFVPVIVVMIALILARAAVWLQIHGISTFLLVPVLVGGILGLSTGWLAACAGRTNRRMVTIGAAVAALLTACGEHGYFYREYRRQFSTAIQSDPKTQLAATLTAEQFEPTTFYGFMVAEAPAKWPLWIADAVTMIAVAAVTAWWRAPRARLPARG
jgi:hypothetical protein